MSGELYGELRRSLVAGDPVLLAEVTRVSDDASTTTPLASKLVVRAGAREDIWWKGDGGARLETE